LAFGTLDLVEDDLAGDRGAQAELAVGLRGLRPGMPRSTRKPRMTGVSLPNSRVLAHTIITSAIGLLVIQNFWPERT
jgi:hypothetical protein